MTWDALPQAHPKANFPRQLRDIRKGIPSDQSYKALEFLRGFKDKARARWQRGLTNWSI